MGGQVRYRSVAVLLLALFLTLAALPLVGTVGPAGAARSQDKVIYNTQSVPGFEVNITGGASYRNVSFSLPLNASAVVVSALFNLTGVFQFEGSPVNLSGWGTALDEGGVYGQGLDAADFNNDGIDDLAVGWAGPNFFGAYAGPGVDVWYGSSAKVTPGRPDWVYFESFGGVEGLGYAITHGDYNNDSIEDLVVGMGYQYFGGTERIYLFFGSASGLPAQPSMNLTMSPTASNAFGRSLAGNLDINGDGFDDLIAGEPEYSGLRGRVDVLWGGPDGLNVTNVTFIAPAGANQFGEVLEAIGDTDGDGLGEFAVGTPQNGTQWGSAAVYEGTMNSTALAVRWSQDASATEYFGYAIAGGYDLSGDGVEDLAVGAPFKDTDGNGFNGAVYLFEGTGNATYSTTSSVVYGAKSLAQENLGISLDAVPDLDGTGLVGLLAGANRHSNWDGRFYLFAQSNLSAPTITNSNATGLGEELGWRSAFVGDLNGDGYDEFAITSRAGTNGSFAPGHTRLYYGSAHPFPEGVQVFVDTTAVASSAGPLRGVFQPSGLETALQSYLASHQSAKNATGWILVPMSINFSGGGRLNVSDISVVNSVVLPPSGVTLTAPASGGSLVLSWQFQPTDGAIYSVWSNKSGAWALVANVSFPRFSYNDTNVSDGQDYWYYLTETDPSVPLTSAPSPIVSGRPADITPPRTPANFTVTVDGPSHTMTLAWSPNGDDTLRYEVWRRDGDLGSLSQVGSVNVPSARYVDTGLLEEVNYTYQVRAIDDAGLPSPFSAARTDRIPDLTAPSTPLNFQATTHPSGTAAVLSWDLNGGDTVTYAVRRSSTGLPGSFSEVGRSPASPYTTTGLQRDQTYYFVLVAIDKVDWESPPTAAVSVLTVDTLAPDAPVLTAATTLGIGNSVQLDWSATGDDLAGFRLFTDVTGSWTPALQVGGAARTAVVGNLTDGRLTHFRVAAFDLGARQGADSNELSATPADTQRPGAPAALSLVAPPAGALIILTWTPPADIDVALYKVWYIDPTVSANWGLAGTSAAATFTHAPVKNGVTFRYQVSALDEVPNESPPSESVSGSARDTVAPSAPLITTLRAVTNDVTFAVAGTAEPNLTVELWVRAVLRATVEVDSSGAWSATAPLITGDNEITARAVDPSPIVDPGAKFSLASQALHVTLDTARPALSASSPATGATGVDAAATISLTFSEEIATVRVTLTDAEGNVINGTLTVDLANNTARFVPSSPLRAGATYRAEVTSTDLAGNAMAPTAVTFTTASAGASGTGGGFLPGLEAPFAGLALAGAALGLAARRRRRRP